MLPFRRLLCILLRLVNPLKTGEACRYAPLLITLVSAIELVSGRWYTAAMLTVIFGAAVTTSCLPEFRSLCGNKRANSGVLRG